MADFKAISTQEEFDAAIKERIERERNKYADYEALKEKAQAAEKLQKSLDAVNAELERLNKESQATAATLAAHTKTVNELTARAETAERSLLCRKIAEEKNLPAALADRLTGKDESELRKDADTLAQFVKTNATAPLSTGDRSPLMGASTHDAAMQAAYSQVLSGLK